MTTWKETIALMKKSKDWHWSFIKKAAKFITAIEECGAKNLVISKLNGDIRFQMPDDIVSRDQIFSFLLERHAREVELRYSKRTKLMRIVW